MSSALGSGSTLGSTLLLGLLSDVLALAGWLDMNDD